MSTNYVIFTDSASNLSDMQIEELDVRVISMNYIADGQLKKSYVKDMDNKKELYDALRKGKTLTTTALNPEEFVDAFTPALKEGKDILYLGFSSGLSLTYENGAKAADGLQASFPERKIVCVDTLAASCGQGLLIYYAAQMRLSGSTLEETAEWTEKNKLKLAHWFTVENLVYLHRGGRVSKASYLLGTLMQIKPVLHVDDTGHLVPMEKVIGRKKSVQRLADKIAEAITEPEKQVIFISHGDCANDAEALVEKLKAKIDVKGYVINMLDLVIGCHSGPGTLAVFCLADKR